MFWINVKNAVFATNILSVLFSFNKCVNSQTCDTIKNEQVVWSDTESPNCVPSNPFCLNEKMEIVTRCCNPDGQWEEAPYCSSYQGTINNPCPERFDWKGNICMFVIEDTIYPAQCPYEETLPFSEYVELVDPKLFPIWMPVKRSIGPYGIDLLRWTEPTIAYKTPYNDHRFDGSVNKKNCLIYYNETFTEAVFCDEKHTAICAYQSLPKKFQSFCSQKLPQDGYCVQSDYSSYSKCFCQGSLKDFSLAPRAEFLEPYQNLLYPSLNSACYIGLEKIDATYVWSNSEVNISYSNWADTATFNEKERYGVMTSSGWVMMETENETDCVIYEVDVPNVKGEMVLRYSDDNKFVLRLTNPSNWLVDEKMLNPIVFCFTDAINNAIFTRLNITGSVIANDEAVFYFQRHADGPGNYWCEAFHYPGVVTETSNKYLLRYSDSYTEEYVVILLTSYDKEINPLLEDNIYGYQKQLAEQVLSLPEIFLFQVRIYKIISVDEDNFQITMNFHLVYPYSSKPLTNYSILRKKMEQDLTNFTFVEILGVDSCVGVQTSGSVTWPVTPVNSLAKPREGYCIGNDGSIVNRLCSGNYIDGAKWLNLEQPCIVQQSANASMNLTNILNMNSPKEYMEQVVEIARNALGLLALDIDLISYFLEQVTNTDTVNIKAVVEIIDYLMLVPLEILREAQTSFNATDRIIHHLQTIIHQSDYIGILVGQNIVIISEYIKDCNISALITQDNADDECSIKDINEITELYAAKVSIHFSDSLMEKLLRNNFVSSKMILTIYKTSCFFNEMSHNRKYTDVIFGVNFPYIQEKNSEISGIYSISDSEENDISCSYWDYDLNNHKGYWEKSEKNISEESVICTYTQPTQFTLIRKEEFNITYALEDVIYSEKTLTEKLKQTFALLTTHHNNFQSDDVHLVSHLLHLVALGEEDNLDLVADIVNMVVIIPKEILEKSQETYNATGKILFYFEQILERSGMSQTVKKEYVYATVQLLNEALFYGFIINNCDEDCNFNLLHEPKSKEEISGIENMDTALLISSDMINQLLHYSKYKYVPKITTIVFLKDSLFVEFNINPKIKTKVVGVYFPNFSDPQEGDITLLYNLSDNFSSEYTCSVYDTVESIVINGFWNAETAPVIKNGIQICEFWKPTYFALIYNLVNFTSILESMLTSTDDMVNILDNINSITKNYCNYLQPIDIFLIAKILFKVESVDEHVLKVCVNIINGVMEVSEAVLRTSQEFYNATNMILDVLNDISGAYQSSIEIYKDNVGLVVALLKETDINGVTLEHCAEHCNTIRKYTNAVLQPASLNSRNLKVELSSDLFNDLLKADSDNYTPAVVLTFFYRNVLFIETTKKNNSQVFGVHFPNYNHILSSEFKVTLQPSTRAELVYVCVSWTFLNENDGSNEGFWTYESRARRSEALTCNFYKQNYFALAEEGPTLKNITKALEKILESDMIVLEKLYKTQDILSYYTQFDSYDIYIISSILMNCNELNSDGLDMVNAMINNILRIPEEVLINSNILYNSLGQILRGFNNISSYDNYRQCAPLTDQFGFVICQLNEDLTNGVILTETDIKCTYEEDDKAFSDVGNVASLILSKEVVTQIVKQCKHPQIIVSVFANTVFFDIEKLQNSTLVLGLSTPDIQEKLENSIMVLFNQYSVGKSTLDCGYWNNYNHWKVADGEYKDLFMKCRYSEPTYFTLWDNKNNSDSINITEILNKILAAEDSTEKRLNQTLQVVSTYTNQFQAYHVFLVSRILSSVYEIHELSSLKIMANLINNIMNIPRDVLVESQDNYNATDWIIYHVNKIAEGVETTVHIETENFAIVISDNISGIFINNCTRNCNLEIISKGANLTSAIMSSSVSTALVVDDNLQGTFQRQSSSSIVVTVYFSNALFNEDGEVAYESISPIIGVVIPSQCISFNGSLQFYHNTDINKTEVCAFWNYNMEQEGVIKGHWKKDKAPLLSSQAAFCESKETTHFVLLQLEKNITSDLEHILNSNSSVEEKLDNVVFILTNMVIKLTPVDIYLISKILEVTLEEIDMNKINITSKIISSLFHVPREVLRESQATYHATDKILHTVEEMSGNLNKTDFDPIVHDNFAVAVFDITDGVTGLKLENCNEARCDITALKGAVNFTELADHKNLQTVIALGPELLDQIRQVENPPNLVVTIFFSDALFNEPSERDGKVSMVCGVLLPGFSEAFLGSLYVAFNSSNDMTHSSSCAFWNFKVQDGQTIVQGSWKPQGDSRNKKHFTVCEFDHITHFALLLAKDISVFSEANKYNILDIITAVNSILSVMGIFGILLTAALFERWRRNTGNQILIHFSVAMSIKMVMIYVSSSIFHVEIRKMMCSITGAILHYAVLSEFCWMLIIAILQFKRFVEVLGGPPKFVLLKACVCGWVFPILPVLLILLIDQENYNQGSAGLCYPSGLALYLGVWLPLIIIVTINLVIFIFIIYNVFHKRTESRDTVNHEILFQWRLALLLFSMLGLTWLFGFLAQIPGAETIFGLIFSISVTLQGFIMFLFFIVFNKSTRFLYSQAIKLWLFDRGYKMH